MYVHNSACNLIMNNIRSDNVDHDYAALKFNPYSDGTKKINKYFLAVAGFFFLFSNTIH